MFIYVFTAFSAHAAAGEVDFLAYGDMRGYLEPCGCDPATDLGGILRINSQLIRERLTTPDLIYLNLGNNLSDKKSDTIKNKYLLQGEEANRPSAYLINELELQNIDLLTTSKLPFVLSNSKMSGQGREIVETSASVVMGYTWKKYLADRTRRVDAKILNEWKKLLEKKSGKKSILLFSGPDQDLEKFVQAKLFDSIVSSNNRPLAEVPGKEESEDERLLLRMKKHNIYMVPIGGQGILRSGRLTMTEAKTFESLFKAPEKDCADGLSTTMKNPIGNCSSQQLFGGKGFSRITWLKKSTEAGHNLATFYTSFNKEVAAQFKVDGLSRLAALKDSPFAGSATCAQCHVDTHKIYSSSRHAKAIKTLIDKGKHEDPECIACHVVGADKQGGFVSIEASPQFANVQCENCHGPRKDHAENPSIKSDLRSAKLGCVSCHNPQHSPNFNLETYWEKIKH